MKWLDDRIAQVAAAAERDRKLQKGATELFAALWEELLVICKEASTKMGVEIKGLTVNPHERQVAIGARTMTFALSDDFRNMSIVGDAMGRIEYQVDLDNSGAPVLMQGHYIDAIPKAAQMIMDRFLFPEFHIKK